MAGEYKVHRCEGKSFTDKFDDLRATVWFEVRFGEDTLVAWRSGSYWATAAPRSISGLRLGASNACKSYQRHFARTGERFEVTEALRKRTERETKKRADRLAWLRKNIPLLNDELKQLEKGLT